MDNSIDSRASQAVPVVDSALTIRTGRPEDAAICGQICYEAFRRVAEQHNFPPDFPSPDASTGLMTMALSRPDVYGLVAERGGAVVGSNFLWEGDSIAGVGPITVSPDVQNSAIGRQLMQGVLDRAAARSCAGARLLQAGYHGRSLALYAKLGFDVKAHVVNLQGVINRNMVEPGFVRPATNGDLEACDDLCTRIHGHNRRSEVRFAHEQGSVMIVVRDGRVTGYTTGIGFFGHAVGASDADIQALIAAAPSIAGPGLLLPSHQGELLRWCLANGLRIVQPMTLMAMGEYQEPRGAWLPSILY